MFSFLFHDSPLVWCYPSTHFGPSVSLYVPSVALHELESKLLKGGYIGEYMGSIIGVIKGGTRSLDYGSHELESKLHAGGCIGEYYRQY